MIGIDNMFPGSYLNPNLSTVGQPMQDMANAAVARVLARMKNRDEPAHEQVFRPEPVRRASTAHWAAVTKLEGQPS